VEHAEQAAEAPEVDAADLHQVEFITSGKSIRVAPGETVHAAAAKVGLLIPKACGMGICGTCKVLKLGGEVEMEHNGGITEEDEAEGYILSCCSVPMGDVRIEF
jgi:ferredoxin